MRAKPGFPVLCRASATARTQEWVAGAGGIEPLHDGLEIGCSRPSERSIKPLTAKVHNQLETLEFGAPF
jgi:hypothetical protein